jgi:PAS domain S-box-containing protein
VVDDEVGPRESLRMLLKTSYEIKTADGARAAMQELRQFKPDLVILDIKMPEVDGLEVLRRIKAADASIEVVMITAYASLETVKLALSHGAFEYLIKPFSRQDLEDVVRRALQRRQADQGARDEVGRLAEEMRCLSAKTRQLEEVARREAAELSLRVTQLSILREIARTVVGQLDPEQMKTAVTGQLRRSLGYDSVAILAEGEAPPDAAGPAVIICAIRDAEGPLGHLVVDNRASNRPIDPRERELLEMLSEYLAVAVRNSRLYSEIATTKGSLEQLIASAGDAIIAVDKADRIGGWNPAAQRVFALSPAQALQRDVTEILPAAQYADAKERLRRGSAMHAFEIAVTRPESRPAALAVTVSAVRDRQGEVEGLIAIVRDITVQREVEAQLHQSEKLTALGQLAGGIAHDFNNLLQAILGYAQLMRQNLTDQALLDRSLKVMESVALDGSETVRRIQQFARLRPDEQFVAVDLNEMVRESVAIIRPRWEETVAHENRRLDLRLDLGRVPVISGRAAELREALTNLLLNAIDAMPGGGVLSLATRTGEGGGAVLSVADTGVGMPDEVRRRIFDPFFTTKGEGGSGLGLAMVYAIVTRHGGEIRVDSEPGRGAVFTLTFPTDRTCLEPPRVPETAPRWRQARVLVIDDDAKVLATLTALLQALGHQVTPVPDALAGLATYGQGRFDAIITNLGMPGMNGWEFAERLRRLDAAVPIIFITGWGLREEDSGRLAALKVDRCLFKPVRPADLDVAIQAALGAA